MSPCTLARTLAALVVALSASTPAGLFAQTLPLANTGYTFASPAGWTVDPNVAGDMVLRAFAPGQNGFIEIYTGTTPMTLSAMAQGYEQKMEMAAKGWQKQQEQQTNIQGTPALYRLYAGNEGGAPIHVQAIFYCKGSRTFIAHAVTTQQMYGQLFNPAQQALLSLSSPSAAQPAMGIPASTGNGVPLRGTGYTLAPPTGWTTDANVSGDMVFRALAPGQNGFLEVYTGTNPMVLPTMARGYEQKMEMAAKGWQKQQEQQVSIKGTPTLYRLYAGNEGGVPIHVQGLFYCKGNRTFILHAVTTQQMYGQLFNPAQRALMSLSSPSVTQPAMGAPVAQGTGVPLKGTGYVFAPPSGWTADANVAGDMAFRAFAPGQNGFLEIYTGVTPMMLPAMAQGYEQKMEMAAKGWQKQQEQQVSIQGMPALYRLYTGSEGGIPINVQVVLYCKGSRTFLLHAVTAQSMHSQLFGPAHQALLSLRDSAGPSAPRKQPFLGLLPQSQPALPIPQLKPSLPAQPKHGMPKLTPPGIRFPLAPPAGNP